MHDLFVSNIENLPISVVKPLKIASIGNSTAIHNDEAIGHETTKEVSSCRSKEPSGSSKGFCSNYNGDY